MLGMSIEQQISIEADNFERELIARFGKEMVESWKQEFKNATIQNDFVFCKTMQKLELCAEVLKRVKIINDAYGVTRGSSP